jgi:hypothetical protein
VEGPYFGTVFFSISYPFTRFPLQFCMGPTTAERTFTPQKIRSQKHARGAELRCYLPGQGGGGGMGACLASYYTRKSNIFSWPSIAASL